MIIAVDFDGTIVKHKYPKIGEDIGAIEWLQKWNALGAKIILYTMRSGGELEEVIDYLYDNSVELYGINKNPDQIDWTISPKAYANLYIDDAAFGCPTIKLEGERPYADWSIIGPAVEKMLLDKWGFYNHYEEMKKDIWKSGFNAGRQRERMEWHIQGPSRYEKMGGEDK